MKNELQKQPSDNLPAKPTTVTQKGKENTYIAHAENLSQTLNINYFVQQPGKPPQQVTKTLNRDCYNLFVIGGEEFSSDHFLVPKNRALIKGTLSDDLFDKFSTLTPEAIEEIKSFPALFASENTDYRGKTDPHQQTIYGIITDIKVQDNGIKIRYQYFNHIPQQTISNLGFYLGINTDTAITELNRTRWTIKKIDLIEALTDNGISVMAPTL